MSSTDQYDKENASPKPAKRALYSYDGCADDEEDDAYHHSSKYSPPTARTGHASYGGDDVTENFNLNAGPPSSPFQIDARDDTVDMNKLQAMMIPSTSRRASPEKKKLGPEIYVDEEDRIEEDLDNNEEVMVQKAIGESAPEAPEFDATAATSSYHGEAMNDNDQDDDSVVHNESKPIENAQIGNSIMEDRHNEGMSTVAHAVSDDDSNTKMNDLHENDPMDDTCFSTFSAVPNVDMTLFAKLGASPTKRVADIVESPTFSRTPAYGRRSKISTPATAHRKGANDNTDTSPTPQRRGHSSNDDSLNLLDFSDSVSYFHRVSQRFSASGNRASISPRRRSPLKPREPLRSPAKYNLLDFDVPPPATPMSIPSITPRELESLKSGFLSEISSLKATLSGKEAEVGSLKQAVADAERRVGEALEEVRNEAIRKEALEVEQAEWERRGKEMETVLREVRAEIIEGECERERLTKKNDEAERLKEQLEGKIVELESQLDAAKKAAAANPVATSAECDSADNNSKQGMMTAEESAKEVQEAVERVARELHTLYKGKHETKVAALKKSYESRWEKRVREAENKFREASEEVERLKNERDSSMSGPIINPNMSVMSTVIGGGRENEELETENKVLAAQIKGLEEQVAAIKRDNEQLHAELKVERSEKGELVAAVDEWLAMQQMQTQAAPPPATTTSREVSTSSSYYSASEQEATMPPSSLEFAHKGGVMDEDPTETQPQSQPQQQSQQPSFRRSISRTGNSTSTLSGLRPPSSGNSNTGLEKRSRLGMYGGGGHKRHNSGGSSNRSIAMPGGTSITATPGRSGIMSSIERMGMGGR